MKSNFKYLIICLFALFCLHSCQDEAIQETDNPEEAITPNSAVANLMRSTASNDGSVDNIMDGTDCFSVNLPVTIVVNDITITINTLEDLALIEEIFDEFQDDEDFLEFLFPITIILNDYTEIVIENEDQLEEFIEECTDDVDETIECVDFVYPISFSIYNSDFQLIDTVVIENDEALYEFLESLEDNPNGAVIASLNYPVSLVYADGSTVEVNSNQELEAAINAAEEECDDDDDEECDLNIQEIEGYLLECSVVAHFSNDNNLDELYFEFLENGELIVNGDPAVTETGSWEIVETDEGYKLIIEGLETFGIANGYWILEECDEDDDWLDLEFVQTVNNESITMELEIDCDDDDEDDCDEEDVAMYLQECIWYSGSNLMNNNDYNGPFIFYGNHEVTIGTDPGNNSEGIWDIATTDDGVIIVLTLPEPYDAISNITWLVVECEEDRIEMVSGDNHLVFERECEDEYDCPDMQANVGDECEDANGNVGYINENCECEVEDDEYDCPDLQANVGDDCEDANGNLGFINEDCECEVEDDNPFECFGNYGLSVCDEDDGTVDGFGVFDLELIFANCPNDDVEYTFHSTLADAESSVNPLANPYTNVVNPDVIYSRVSLASDPNVYEVFTHELHVEVCNPAGCSEQEVDAYLVECIWNAVSYNGDDHLIEYNFDFESNSNIVVIYTDSITIDATWSTSQSEDGVIIEFSNVAGPDIQAITGSWLVVECENDRLELHRENDFMVLEQTCE